jgi:predicted dehydrogenase
MVLRIGVLGAARIAPPALIQPARAIGGVTVLAVGASDPTRAAAFGAEHGISVCGTREALLARDDLDLIYVALPPSDHAAWSIRALEAGKNVLCEKPFAVSAAQTEAVQAAAARAGKRVIEATHYRYHPLMARVLEILQSGALGRIVSAQAAFHVPVREAPDEFRRTPALGGGCLRDIGFYPLHALRTMFGEPVDVLDAAAVWVGHDDRYDESFQATLHFADGLAAQLSCGMALTEQPRATIHLTGERGTLSVRNFVGPHYGATIRLSLAGKDADHEEAVTTRPTFFYQLEAVRDGLASGASLPTEGADVLANMRAMDALYALV